MTDKATFAKGDKVSWMTSQGRTRGAVVRTATRAFKIKDFRIAASKHDPRIVVKSALSGEMAAHKPSALRKIKG